MMLAEQLTEALNKNRESVRAYNRMRPQWTPPIYMRGSFLVGRFTFPGSNGTDKPVYIDRRYVPRSKYMPHIGDKQKAKATK